MITSAGWHVIALVDTGAKPNSAPDGHCGGLSDPVRVIVTDVVVTDTGVGDVYESTAPCPVYRADATFVPEPEPGIRVSPPWKSKARRGAELAMAALKGPGRAAAT